ncbi:MFS transporter [Ktedonosporobacter rubrisoli]|uniref:MFS transporter n=1 Tax=Ktedonosporobacter rubrisoli TaxID=2509675 RepID=A0A4V0Z074_KTERU|nr:MFS transporter [Ktedonosporobacter rubrisoli]QBD82231.1 MFS transporter [Ktedonosporobacter rubrisoli]
MHLSTHFKAYRELLSIRNVRWLFIASLLANTMFYSTVMVQYETLRGLNFTEMFALEAIISIAAWLFEIPSGIFADRLGYRPTLLLGYASNLASLLLFIITRGFWPFALASALFGLNLACLSGCEDALIYESLPQERSAELSPAAFALLNAARNVGFFAGLATGSFFGTHDPALPFIITLIPLGLAFVAILRLQSVPRHAQLASQNGLAPLSTVEFLRSALQLIRRYPALVSLSLVQSAAFTLVNAIYWYNQPYFAQAGIAVLWFGPLTAAAVGLSMLVVLTTPAAKKVPGTRMALALSCLIPGVGYIALAATRDPLPTVLLIMAIIVGSAWRSTIISDILNRHIKDGSRATTLSVLSFLGALAGMAFNPLIGYVGDLGLTTTGLGLGTMLMLLGLIAYFLA